MTVPQSPARFAILAILGLAGLTMLATPVGAQSERDLRAENQRLRTEVKDTQLELEAARRQITQLETRITQLEAALDAARRGGGPVSTPPKQPEVTVDESVPEASPRALLKAMTKSYEEELGALELGAEDSRERTAYLRALEHWHAKVNRRFRTQVEWHVRFDGIEPTPRGFAIRTVAVDPVTDVELGDHFYVLLPRSLERRVNALTSRSSGPYVLRGVAVPNVTLNLDRASAGTFDRPPLIGPFAQFEFGVEADSLVEPKAAEKGDDKKSP